MPSLVNKTLLQRGLLPRSLVPQNLLVGRGTVLPSVGAVANITLDAFTLAATGELRERQFPTSGAAWAAAFPTLPVPVGIWTFSEGSTPIDDKIGANDFVANGSATGLSYAQAGDTEPLPSPKTGLEFTVAATTEWLEISADTTFGNVAVGGSYMWLIRFRNPDNAATQRSILGKGAGAGARYGLRVTATTGVLNCLVSDGTASTTASTASAYDDGGYYDVIFGIDSVADTVRIITATENISTAQAAGLVTTINASGLVVATSTRLGAVVSASPTVGLRVSYVAAFNTVLTQANLTTFRTPV